MDQMMTPTAPQHGMLRSHSVAETQRLGALLGGLLAPGDVVLLHGDLGAGKTAFTQGIAVGLGVARAVNSPTFTILKEYEGRLPLYHFDLYRIESPDEVYALGFEEYLDGAGVSVIEWAERGEPAVVDDGAPDAADTLDELHEAQAAAETAADRTSPWPPRWLRIALAPVGGADRDARTLTLTARGPRGRALLAAYLEAVLADSLTAGTLDGRAAASPTQRRPRTTRGTASAAAPPNRAEGDGDAARD